jgi:ribosomal protein L1
MSTARALDRCASRRAFDLSRALVDAVSLARASTPLIAAPSGRALSFARAYGTAGADGDVESANAPDAPRRVTTSPQPIVSVRDAVRWVRANAPSKRFAESVELAVHLGVDPKRSDMIVRGSARLPHGTGKNVRVCVFAEGEAAETARAAGAQTVGGDALVERIKSGGSGAIDFDKAIAVPEMMTKLREIARILGPRGLMPNPKLGTVTTEVAEAVREHLGGRVEFRAEKNAIVHAAVGKVNFSEEQIEENIAAVYRELWDLRPKGKGAPNASKYVKKAYLASTMGRGSARIEVADLNDAIANKSKN